MTDADLHAPPAPEVPPADRLKGRRIVITGAASGIGLATARLFAAEGAALTLLDRDAGGLAAIASETGGHSFTVDIAEEAQV